MTNEFNPDWMCVCGDLTTLGVVHRKDGPCYMPEPKREWVGLTDEEMAKAIGFTEFTVESTKTTLTYVARAIEAKLKEKNT